MNTQEKDDTSSSDISVAFSVLCIFGAAGIFCYQVYVFLRFGYWQPISVVTALARLGLKWALMPEQWIGLHKVLDIVPLSLALFVSAFIPIWISPSVEKKKSKKSLDEQQSVPRSPNLSDQAPWTTDNDELVEAIIKSNTHPQIGIDRINEILTRGININARNESGRTALSIANYYEAPSAVRALLAKAGAKG